MLNAFAAGQRALHRDPNRSVPATYTPAGEGDPVQLRVIRSSPELNTDTGGDWMRNGAVVFSATTADIPDRPVKGATVTVGAGTWWVYDARPDTMGLSWRMFCQPVA